MAENSDRLTDRPDMLAQTIRDALYVLVQKGSEDRAAQALDALDNLLNENKRLLEQEKFERQQLADAYKRDLVLLKQLEAENNRLRGQVQEFQDRWDGLVKGGRDDEAVSMYNNGYVNSLIRERNSAEAVLQRIAGREWLSADVAEQMRAEARAATGWK